MSSSLDIKSVFRKVYEEYCKEFMETWVIVKGGTLKCSDGLIPVFEHFHDKYEFLAKTIFGAAHVPLPVKLSRQSFRDIEMDNFNKQILLQVYGFWWAVYFHCCTSLGREVKGVEKPADVLFDDEVN